MYIYVCRVYLCMYVRMYVVCMYAVCMHVCIRAGSLGCSFCPIPYLFGHVCVVPSIAWRCIGLRYMHSKGVAHVDLSPDNILVLRDCSSAVKACIIDMGQAVATDVGGFATVMRHRLRTMKRQCIAPELTRPIVRAAINAFAVDSWALGTIAYHMLVGRFLFDAVSLDHCRNYARICDDSAMIAYIAAVEHNTPISEHFSGLLKGVLQHDACVRLHPLELQRW